MGCQTRRVYRDSFSCFQQRRLRSVLIRTFGDLSCGYLWRAGNKLWKSGLRGISAERAPRWGKQTLVKEGEGRRGKERKPRPGPDSGALSGLGRVVGDISQIRMDHKPLDAIQFCGAAIRRLITCHPSIRPPLRRCLPSHKSTHDKMTPPPPKHPTPPRSLGHLASRERSTLSGGAGLQGRK